jgi:CubicO group peptidase (beta-lactamase class C family)
MPGIADPTGLAAAVDAVAAEHDFSGVVEVARGDERVFARGYGLAHRAHGLPNTVDTRLAIASGVKGLTAVTVLSLVADGVLALDTPARDLLGTDLPLVADDVTVRHLLAHRSGIGDYLDEESGAAIEEYVLTTPAHLLDSTPAYLRVLDGHPTRFPAGSRFAYCNGGYVLLALLAERAAGTAFPDLVRRRVCGPAGMSDTGFPRSDELPAHTATGYVRVDGSWRSNVFHLPVMGSGDGGAYATVADLTRFWRALFAGRLVPPEQVDLMTRPHSDAGKGMRYGLGFWLPEAGGVRLEGYDAGVSFRSVHEPGSGLTHTVVANTSPGAWPVTRRLTEILGC